MVRDDTQRAFADEALNDRHGDVSFAGGLV